MITRTPIKRKRYVEEYACGCSIDLEWRKEAIGYCATHGDESRRIIPYPIQRKRAGKPRRGRLLDPKYLAWIHTLPCVVCDTWSDTQQQVTPTEAAHVGDRGLWQRCDDRESIPLCVFHHRTGRTAHHRLGKLFWGFHGLDREALIADLQQRYESSVK